MSPGVAVMWSIGPGHIIFEWKEHCESLKLCSCGIKEKFQDPDMVQFSLQFHAVWLLEVKNTHQISVKGLNVYYKCSKKGSCRGGGVEVVKCVLTQYIPKVIAYP